MDVVRVHVVLLQVLREKTPIKIFIIVIDQSQALSIHFQLYSVKKRKEKCCVRTEFVKLATKENFFCFYPMGVSMPPELSAPPLQPNSFIILNPLLFSFNSLLANWSVFVLSDLLVVVPIVVSILVLFVSSFFCSNVSGILILFQWHTNKKKKKQFTNPQSVAFFPHLLQSDISGKGFSILFIGGCSLRYRLIIHIHRAFSAN